MAGSDDVVDGRGSFALIPTGAPLSLGRAHGKPAPLPPGDRWARTGQGAAYLGLVAVQVVLAALTVRNPTAMVPVLGVCAVIMLFVARGGLFVLALPMCFASTRIAVVGVDVSIADAVIAAMVIAAVPFVDWSNATVRRAVLIGAAHLTMLVVNVAVVTTSQAVTEWVHRWFLLVGPIIIGAAIASTGRTTAALRAVLSVAVVFAVASVFQSIGTGFEPAYTFGYHKNFVGPLLAMTSLTVLAGRREFAMPSWMLTAAQAVLLAGLAATQSRASILGLVAGAVVLSVRRRRIRWRSVALVPVLAVLCYFVFDSIRTSLTGSNDTRFSPIRTRLAQYDSAWDHFVDNPVFGLGIRWFKTPGTIEAEPHSAVFSTLSETGLWGMLALIGLVLGVWLLLRRRSSPLADAALAVIVFRLVEGQFAIFWLAGIMSYPWLVVGLAVGADGGSPDDTVVAGPSDAVPTGRLDSGPT